MSVSLDEFVGDIHAKAVFFQQAYKKQHKEHPEEYPLIIGDENSGVWIEFFSYYLETGRI